MDPLQYPNQKLGQNQKFCKDQNILVRNMKCLFPHEYKGQIVHWMYPAYQSTIVMLISWEYLAKFSSIIHATLNGNILKSSFKMLSHLKTLKGSSMQSIMLKDDNLIFLNEYKNDLSTYNHITVTQWNLRTYQYITVPVYQYASQSRLFGFPETNLFCVVRTMQMKQQRQQPYLNAIQFSCFKYPLQPNDTPYRTIKIDLSQQPRAQPHLFMINQMNYRSLISVFNQELDQSSQKLQVQTFDCFKQYPDNQLTKHVFTYISQKLCSKQIISMWELKQNLWVLSMRKLKDRKSNIREFHLCNLNTCELISVVQRIDQVYDLLSHFNFINKYVTNSKAQSSCIPILQSDKEATLMANMSRCFETDLLANTKNFKTVGSIYDKYFKFDLKTSYPQYNPRLMITYDKGQKQSKNTEMANFLMLHNLPMPPQLEQLQNDWFEFEVKYIRDERLIQSNLIAMFLEQLIRDCDQDLIRLIIQSTCKQEQSLWGI